MNVLAEQYERIKVALLRSDIRDPMALARQVMREEGLASNGPAHHFLDGAAFLTAFRNAGGQLDLPRALDILARHAERMPDGMCDSFGVCGAVTSVGAAMAIIHKMTPGADGERYRAHMKYSARALSELSDLGGPRCCKRNGFLAITMGVRFLNEACGTTLTLAPAPCPFSAENRSCLGAKCPFFGGRGISD
ncbi:MAG: SAM-dependent methyltransferase [Clostridia bacterium]|nr:SAM-dependent methyltransferase [Clostridia bacterium]